MLLGSSLSTNSHQRVLSKFLKCVVYAEVTIRGNVGKISKTPGVYSKDYILYNKKDNTHLLFSEQIPVTSQANP